MGSKQRSADGHALPMTPSRRSLLTAGAAVTTRCALLLLARLLTPTPVRRIILHSEAARASQRRAVHTAPLPRSARRLAVWPQGAAPPETPRDRWQLP